MLLVASLLAAAGLSVALLVLPLNTTRRAQSLFAKAAVSDVVGAVARHLHLTESEAADLLAMAEQERGAVIRTTRIWRYVTAASAPVLLLLVWWARGLASDTTITALALPMVAALVWISFHSGKLAGGVLWATAQLAPIVTLCRLYQATLQSKVDASQVQILSAAALRATKTSRSLSTMRREIEAERRHHRVFPSTDALRAIASQGLLAKLNEPS